MSKICCEELAFPGRTKGKKWSVSYSLKIAPLIHPESDMVALTPVVAPVSSSGMYRFPLNMKNGGRLFPAALAHPIKVTVVDLGVVMD